VRGAVCSRKRQFTGLCDKFLMARIYSSYHAENAYVKFGASITVASIGRDDVVFKSCFLCFLETKCTNLVQGVLINFFMLRGGDPVVAFVPEGLTAKAPHVIIGFGSTCAAISLILPYPIAGSSNFNTKLTRTF